MAVQQITIPPDARRDTRARELAPLVASWPRHTLKVAVGAFPAGTMFRRASGSNGARYLVNAVACQCPDYQQSNRICKHIRAVCLFEADEQSASDALTKYNELFPACRDCGDLADGRDGYCSKCASDREWQARRDDASR